MEVRTWRKTTLCGERVHRRVLNEIICRSSVARQCKRLDAQLRQHGDEIGMKIIGHLLLLDRKDMLRPIMSDVLRRPAGDRWLEGNPNMRNTPHTLAAVCAPQLRPALRQASARLRTA
jgi:hypothetical protein